MDKKQIRQKMKSQRAKLSKEIVLENSSLIWNQIYKMPLFRSATTILLYSSIGNEVSTLEIAKKALSLGKQIAYPVTNTTNNTMAFHTLKDLNELTPVKSGSFSLLEPPPNKDTKVIPNVTTLMIVPGLAFDHNGYRTGYGGGFYDKYIESHPILSTIGVCYDFQVIPKIPTNQYDQAVQRVVVPRV